MLEGRKQSRVEVMDISGKRRAAISETALRITI